MPPSLDLWTSFLCGSPGYMHLDGRLEKRISLAVPVYLVSLKEPRAAEQVLTENVSSRGARVVTNRRWQAGEQQRITPLSGEFQLQARVVYCRPLSNRAFCVGLEFHKCSVAWWDSFLTRAMRIAR